MAWIFDIQIWLALLTLTVLEIVLGIDNVIFISILTGKLPPGMRTKARRLGIGFALITRVLLLCTLFWLIGLTRPLVTIYGLSFAGKDFVLILGGLFLIAKGTREIHGSIEPQAEEETLQPKSANPRGTLTATVVQIMLLDIVFSLDSVITAIGMAQQIAVMITAVVLAMGVMLWASGVISDFVNTHPTIKMLALSFLLLIGVVLVADGFGREIPRGYIYFAMAYAFIVELLNIRVRAKHKKPGKEK